MLKEFKEWLKEENKDAEKLLKFVNFKYIPDDDWAGTFEYSYEGEFEDNYDNMNKKLKKVKEKLKEKVKDKQDKKVKCGTPGITDGESGNTSGSVNALFSVNGFSAIDPDCKQTKLKDISLEIIAPAGGTPVSGNTGKEQPFSFTLDAYGSWEIRTNVSGLIEVIRTIVISSVGEPPIITLTGSNPVEFDRNTAYVEFDATATDTEDGGPFAVTNIDSTGVDITKTGEYFVTYNYQDLDSNDAVEVVRTVHVCKAGENWNPATEKCE